MGQTGTGEIQVGDELLDYLVELGDILDLILQAASDAKTISNQLEETYRGKASEELEIYFDAISAHINRLSMLYSKSAQYITNTYETMYKTEDQLINWIIKNMG